MSRRNTFEGLLINRCWCACLSFGRRHAAHGTSAGDIAGGELCLDLLEPKMPCGACDLALTQDDQVGAKGRQICHLSVRMGSGEDIDARLGGARLLNDLAGFEAVRDGNDQVIGEEGRRSMKSPLKSGLSAAVSGVAVGALAFPVLAEGLPPTSLAHIRPIPVAAPEPPLPEQVAAWCKFPNVTNKIFRQTEIASPVLAEIAIPSLKKEIFPAIVEEVFGVKIALTESTFSFEDDSQDPRFSSDL